MAHELHEHGLLVALSFLSLFIFSALPSVFLLLLSLFFLLLPPLCLQKEAFVIWRVVVGHQLVGKEKWLLQITDVTIVIGPVSLCQLIPAPSGGIYPANDVNSFNRWWQLSTRYDRNKALRYRNCWTSVDMNDMTFSLPVMTSSKTHGHLQADQMILRPTIEPQLDYHLTNKFCGDSTKLP